VLERIEAWDLTVPHTAWIARHALRTLIKKGDRRALAVIGAGARAEIRLDAFHVTPRRIALGDELTLTCHLTSAARASQRLVIDYIIHYVKQSGSASTKVFKWKEVTLAPGEKLTLSKRQRVRDFTTRKHHAGKHLVEVMVNGERVAEDAFHLSLPR
jgi:hypothetical protein